ncbi:ShET2/EspL2 family type III secretion system effector toxin [Enterobacter cloacae]|uniref:ShET2/EspL2 family type III secretion system effector toxin n=1 Tax=Enterobacter cloacae TaxID=550 RepID=UPI002FF9F8E0
MPYSNNVNKSRNPTTDSGAVSNNPVLEQPASGVIRHAERVVNTAIVLTRRGTATGNSVAPPATNDRNPLNVNIAQMREGTENHFGASGSIRLPPSSNSPAVRKPPRPQKSTPYFSEKRGKPYSLNGKIKDNNGKKISCLPLALYWEQQFIQTEGKVDYSHPATFIRNTDSFQKNDIPLGNDIHHGLDNHFHRPATVTLATNDEWGGIIADTFRDMKKSNVPIRTLTISSSDHCMVAGLKIKKTGSGDIMVIQFYDPNMTLTHQRAAFSGNNIAEVEKLTAGDFITPVRMALYNLHRDGEVAFIDRSHPNSRYCSGRRSSMPPTSQTIHLAMEWNLDGVIRELSEQIQHRQLTFSPEDLMQLLNSETRKAPRRLTGLYEALGRGHVNVIRAWGELLMTCRLSPEQCADLLAARNSDGTPGVLIAMLRGGAGSIQAWGELLLNSGLSQELRAELLAARKGGLQGLYIALSKGKSDIVRAWGELLLKSGLSQEQLADLLAARSSDGVPGLFIALQEGQDDAIRAWGELLLKSGLSQELRAELLAAMRGDGVPGVHMALHNGHTDTIRTFSRLIHAAGYTPEQYVQMLSRQLPVDSLLPLIDALTPEESPHLPQFATGEDELPVLHRWNSIETHLKELEDIDASQDGFWHANEKQTLLDGIISGLETLHDLGVIPTNRSYRKEMANDSLQDIRRECIEELKRDYPNYDELSLEEQESIYAQVIHNNYAQRADIHSNLEAFCGEICAIMYHAMIEAGVSSQELRHVSFIVDTHDASEPKDAHSVILYSRNNIAQFDSPSDTNYKPFSLDEICTHIYNSKSDFVVINPWGTDKVMKFDNCETLDAIRNRIVIMLEEADITGDINMVVQSKITTLVEDSDDESTADNPEITWSEYFWRFSSRLKESLFQGSGNVTESNEVPAIMDEFNGSSSQGKEEPVQAKRKEERQTRLYTEALNSLLPRANATHVRNALRSILTPGSWASRGGDVSVELLCNILRIRLSIEEVTRDGITERRGTAYTVGNNDGPVYRLQRINGRHYEPLVDGIWQSVPDDGDCLFHSIEMVMRGTIASSQRVQEHRIRLAEYIIENQDEVEPFLNYVEPGGAANSMQPPGKGANHQSDTTKALAESEGELPGHSPASPAPESQAKRPKLASALTTNPPASPTHYQERTRAEASNGVSTARNTATDRGANQLRQSGRRNNHSDFSRAELFTRIDPDVSLHIYTPGNNDPQVFGQGRHVVRLLLSDNHYTPWINGAWQNVPADGNSFYHSVSLALTGQLVSPVLLQKVRTLEHKYLIAHPNEFAGFVVSSGQDVPSPSGNSGEQSVLSAEVPVASQAVRQSTSAFAVSGGDWDAVLARQTVAGEPSLSIDEQEDVKLARYLITANNFATADELRQILTQEQNGVNALQAEVRDNHLRIDALYLRLLQVFLERDPTSDAADLVAQLLCHEGGRSGNHSIGNKLGWLLTRINNTHRRPYHKTLHSNRRDYSSGDIINPVGEKAIGAYIDITHTLDRRCSKKIRKEFFDAIESYRRRHTFDNIVLYKRRNPSGIPLSGNDISHIERWIYDDALYSAMLSEEFERIKAINKFLETTTINSRSGNYVTEENFEEIIDFCRRNAKDRYKIISYLNGMGIETGAGEQRYRRPEVLERRVEEIRNSPEAKEIKRRAMSKHGPFLNPWDIDRYASEVGDGVADLILSDKSIDEDIDKFANKKKAAEARLSRAQSEAERKYASITDISERAWLRINRTSMRLQDGSDDGYRGIAKIIGQGELEGQSSGLVEMGTKRLMSKIKSKIEGSVWRELNGNKVLEVARDMTEESKIIMARVILRKLLMSLKVMREDSARVMARELENELLPEVVNEINRQVQEEYVTPSVHMERLKEIVRRISGTLLIVLPEEVVTKLALQLSRDLSDEVYWEIRIDTEEKVARVIPADRRMEMARAILRHVSSGLAGEISPEQAREIERKIEQGVNKCQSGIIRFDREKKEKQVIRIDRRMEMARAILRHVSSGLSGAISAEQAREIERQIEEGVNNNQTGVRIPGVRVIPVDRRMEIARAILGNIRSGLSGAISAEQAREIAQQIEQGMKNYQSEVIRHGRDERKQEAMRNNMDGGEVNRVKGRVVQEEKERVAREEKERVAREEKERIRQDERERVRQDERERVRQDERERVRQDERERVRQDERERVRQDERERVRQDERERVRQDEKERVKERVKESVVQEEKNRQKEQERKKEVDKEKVRLRLIEEDRVKQIEAQRQRDLERKKAEEEAKENSEREAREREERGRAELMSTVAGRANTYQNSDGTEPRVRFDRQQVVFHPDRYSSPHQGGEQYVSSPSAQETLRLRTR